MPSAAGPLPTDAACTFAAASGGLGAGETTAPSGVAGTAQNHEIRTPLVGVVGVTDMLLLTGKVAPEVAEQLHVIHESGNALLQIVNNILDFSKLSAGRARLDLRAADVRAAVSAVAGTFRALALSRGLRYDIQVASTVPDQILTDAVRLQQIVGNLLSSTDVGRGAGAGPDRVRRLSGRMRHRRERCSMRTRARARRTQTASSLRARGASGSTLATLPPARHRST